MKKDNTKKEIVYTPIVLLKNIVVFQLIFVCIILEFGDIVREITDLSMVFTRYVSVGVITLISVYFYLKSSVSKCLLEDKEEVRKKTILAPIIVAVIIFVYGLYSVESNMSALKSNNYSYYSMFLSDNEMDEILEQAASEARVSWIVTSIVYFVVAECATFMLNRKLDELLILKDVTSEDAGNDFSANDLIIDGKEDVFI